MPDQAELIKVADGIDAELKAGYTAGHFGDLAQFLGLDAFTPERSYADWADELEQIDVLKIDVVPIAYDEAELQTPFMVGYVCRSHVGVRYKFPRSDTDGDKGRIAKASIDRLVLFVQDIDSFFRKEAHRRLTSFPEAAWQEGKIVSTYSRKYLRDQRLFFGLLRMTHAVSKEL